MSSCATEEVCFEEFCILKERNEKKKRGGKKETQRCWRRLNVITLWTRRTTIHRREWREFVSVALILRDFRHTDARNGCMHACMHRTVATKYSRIHATAGHTRIPPFAKYFGWMSWLCSLFHPFACVMGVQQLENETRITILTAENSNAKLERTR